MKKEKKRKDSTALNPLTQWSRAVFLLRDKGKRTIDTILGFGAFWNVLIVIILFFLATQQKCGGQVEKFEEGQVAPYDISSPFDFEIQDEQRTSEKREEARRNSLDVYSYDSRQAERFTSSFNIIFAELETLLPDHPILTKRTADDTMREPLGLEKVFSRLPKDVAPDQIQSLRKLSLNHAVSQRFLEDLSKILRRKIIANKKTLPQSKEIIIRSYHEGREQRMEDFSDIIDINQAEQQVKTLIEGIDILNAKEKESLGTLLARMIDANLNYDLSESVKNQNEAASSVPPMVEKFPKGTIIIRKGDRFTSNELSVLEHINRRRTVRFNPSEAFGLLLIFVSAVFFLWRYNVYHQRDFKKFRNLHSLMVIVLLVTSLIARGIIWLASSIVDNLNFPFNQVESYYYLIPVAAGSMLLTLLATGRIAIVYSIFSSMIVGILTGWDLRIMFFSLNSSFAAIYGITQYKMRSALLKSGLIVGAVNVFSIIALSFIDGKVGALQPLLLNICTGFIGGAIAVPLLVSFLLPILEWLFNILTDIRLLELSNLNNPLLSKFALRAPGSYNHSIIMATIAESAAEAIGANALFCRVAAYYHDIGKMSKPTYFVENQGGGYNPHEKLSPSMSTLILISHIKEGIRFAKEYGIPQQIMDIIPQHHGTRLITFFYQKAKKSSDPNIPELDEDAFRYPGPKPQTKEASIFMLADAVEAAARTIENPTPAKMKEMVKKLSGDIVLDDQLDQCDLTFSDLEKISSSFVKTLSGIYHHRIDYPGYDFDHLPQKMSEESL